MTCRSRQGAGQPLDFSTIDIDQTALVAYEPNDLAEGAA